MPHFLQNILNAKKDFSNESDDARIDSQLDRFDMYYDDYKDKVEALVKKQFHPDNQADMLNMIFAQYNFLKKITDLKTVIYKKEAVRKYLLSSETADNGETTDTFSDDFEDILSASNINSTMPQVDKYANINNISAARIMLNRRKDGIDYSPVPAHEVFIEQHSDDPLRIVGLVHIIKIVDTPDDIQRKYFHWTTGESVTDEPELGEDGVPLARVGHYRIYNDDGDIMPQESNPNNLNPYVSKEGEYIIPYVFFRTVRSDQFWNETANQDVFDSTVQINVNYTHKNNLMKFFGYNQLFIVGDIEVSSLVGRRSDPSSILHVKPTAGTDKADIKGISLSTRLEELDKAIFVQISQAADVQNVSLNADSMSAQRQTAEALTINRKSLTEMREKLLPIYRDAEKEMAFKTIVIANTSTSDSGLGKAIPEDGTFMIDFAELDDPSTPKERAETDLIKTTAQTWNPIMTIMRDNPDLDEDQARLQWEKNKEVNGNNGGGLSLTAPTQPTGAIETEPES